MVPSWNHRHIFHSSSDFVPVGSAPCSAPGHLLGGCSPPPVFPWPPGPAPWRPPQSTRDGVPLPHTCTGPKPHPAQGPSGQPGLSQVKFNLGWKRQRAEIKRSLYFKGGGQGGGGCRQGVVSAPRRWAALRNGNPWETAVGTMKLGWGPSPPSPFALQLCLCQSVWHLPGQLPLVARR